MTPENRVNLMRGLRHADQFYANAPGPAGFEAMRLLRLAGVSWPDLLPGEPFNDPDELSRSLRWAYRSHPPAATYARAARALIAFATAGELLQMVLLLNGMDPVWPDYDRAERLETIIEAFLQRRAQVAETAI